MNQYFNFHFVSPFSSQLVPTVPHHYFTLCTGKYDDDENSNDDENSKDDDSEDDDDDSGDNDDSEDIDDS